MINFIGVGSGWGWPGFLLLFFNYLFHYACDVMGDGRQFLRRHKLKVYTFLPFY